MATLVFPALEPVLPYLQSDGFEERPLLHALQAAGVEVRFVDWTTPADAVGAYDAVSPKFLWGYHLQPEMWRSTLEAFPADMWINAKELLQWNADKTYLLELRDKGVDVGELAIIAAGESVDLVALAQERGWQELVIKPTLSAASTDTFRGDAVSLQEPAVRILSDRALIVQPFFEDVLTSGEVSLIYANDTFCYALSRKAVPGDFRAHPAFGGDTELLSPPPKMLEQGASVLAQLPCLPTYARIDGFPRGDDTLLISEVEVLDPNLFVGWAPEAALKPLAAAFAAACG
jgi:hypothetical protein